MFIKPKCYRYHAEKTITIYNLNKRMVDSRVSTCPRADNKIKLKIKLNNETASADNQIWPERRYHLPSTNAICKNSWLNF